MMIYDSADFKGKNLCKFSTFLWEEKSRLCLLLLQQRPCPWGTHQAKVLLGIKAKSWEKKRVWTSPATTQENNNMKSFEGQYSVSALSCCYYPKPTSTCVVIFYKDYDLNFSIKCQFIECLCKIKDKVVTKLLIFKVKNIDIWNLAILEYFFLIRQKSISIKKSLKNQKKSNILLEFWGDLTICFLPKQFVKFP